METIPQIDTSERTPPPPPAPRPSLLHALRNHLIVTSIFQIASSLFNFWSWIPWVFAAILGVIGWTVKPPEGVRHTFDSGKHWVEGALGKHAEAGTDGVRPVVNLNPFKKTEAEIDAVAARKEAERRRKEEAEIRQWKARAELIGFPCEEGWSLEDYRVKVSAAEKAAREKERDDKQRAEEEPERKLLFARADKVGLEADPAWDIKMFRKQVDEAEEEARMDAQYQASLRAYQAAHDEWQNRTRRGPNAACPNPRCRYPMKLGDGRMNGKGICPKCNLIFPCRQARASFTPPPEPREPEPPKKKKSLLKRAFG